MKKILLICCLFIGLTTVSRAQSAHNTGEPKEKAKALQKQLKLSDDQTAKIAAIYTESAAKYEKIKVAEKGNSDKILVAIRPLHAATITKIKAVLKPKQVTAYDKLLKQDTSASGGGWGDGWSAPAQN